MCSKPRLEKYMARVEYRAVKSEVDAQVAQGYSMKYIYSQLHDAGRITMGLTTFCDYIKGEGERQHSRKKKGVRLAAARSNSVPQSNPIRSDKPGPGPGSGGAGFSHNPNVDLKELGPGK